MLIFWMDGRMDQMEGWMAEFSIEEKKKRMENTKNKNKTISSYYQNIHIRHKICFDAEVFNINLDSTEGDST